MLSDNSRVNVKSYNRLLGVILLIALIARLSWVLAVPTQPISDFKEYDRLAVGLLSGKGYVNINSQPTAYRAPGYSFFVAGIYSIFGQHNIAIRLTQVMLGVLTCWLTYSIATELFDRRVALLAAFLIAIFPSLIAWTNILATENLFFPISLGIIISFIKGAKPLAIRWPWLALSGFLAGIAVLPFAPETKGQPLPE